LWHGANWTFVCWGVYHACLIALFILLGINTKEKDVVAKGKWLPSLKEFGQMAMTFVLVIIGWIIFRAENMTQAYDFLSRMFVTLFDDYHIAVGNARKDLAYGTVLLLVEWLQRDKQHALQLPETGWLKYAWTRYAIYAAIAYTIFMYAGEVQTFIYFQF
jgi:hypothetical protein